MAIQQPLVTQQLLLQLAKTYANGEQKRPAKTATPAETPVEATSEVADRHPLDIELDDVEAELAALATERDVTIPAINFATNARINEMGTVNILELDNTAGAAFAGEQQFLFAKLAANNVRRREIEKRVIALNKRRMQLQEARSRRTAIVDFKSSIITQLELKRQKLVDELTKVEEELRRQRE